MMLLANMKSGRGGLERGERAYDLHHRLALAGEGAGGQRILPRKALRVAEVGPALSLLSGRLELGVLLLHQNAGIAAYLAAPRPESLSEPKPHLLLPGLD